MAQDRPKVIIIAGPTATGKTSLAIALGQELGAEIVNADSMQVYRGMDIGTAKPTAEERSKVVHHLLDVVYPDEPFNAAIYRSLALSCIEDIVGRGKICIVVGGTGLYIRTLLGGLFSCPPPDPDLRARLIHEYEAYGPQEMHARLTNVDPEAAQKIHPNDKIRVTRALEIYELTGRRPSELGQKHGFQERPLEDLQFCLYLDRQILYERINRRSVEMVERGLVDETRKLLEKGYSRHLKPMQAIGYRHMVSYIMGECGLDEAIEDLQRDTRRYAKRQLTWFRAEPKAHWVQPDQYHDILKKIEEFVHG